MNPTQHREGSQPAGRYRIGDIVVDARSRTVHSPEGLTELTPRVFDLFLALLSEPNETLHRDTLFERVWGTTCLEDSNLTQGIFVIRKALGDARKHWVKTVPKTGYRFEPPGEVVFEPLPASPGEPYPTTIRRLDAVDAPPVMPRRVAAPAPRSRLMSWLASCALVVMLLGLPGSRTASTLAASADATATQRATIAVMLVDASPTGTEIERQATLLLREWVRWKLSKLPSVVLIEEEDLLAARSYESYALTLVMSASRTRPGGFDVRIALEPLYQTGTSGDAAVRREREHTLTLDGNATSLPAVVDNASSETLSSLFHRRSTERWPPLSLEPATAIRFAEAAQSHRQRAANAPELLEDVVKAAPGFGPARLLLAENHAEHKRFRQAEEQAGLALTQSRPLPPDAAALVAAEAAALSRTRSDDALRLYRTLQASTPSRLDFVLAQVGVLLRSSRPEEAYRLLQSTEWGQQSSNLHIRQLIARAEAAFLLGYLEQSEQSSDEAISLLESAPERRSLELGTALYHSARAFAQLYDYKYAVEQFTSAATTFAAGGYVQDTEVARFYAFMYDKDVARARQQLQRATAMTRSNGDPITEVWLYRFMAILYRWDDKPDQSVLALNEAYRSASLAGNLPSRQLIELDLLEVDLKSGDLAQAGRRVARLQNNRLWTKYHFRAYGYESEYLSYMGRYREALAVLDEVLAGAGRANRLDMPAREAGGIACARLYALVRLGELDRARSQLRGCRDADRPTALLRAARIEYYAGNESLARTHLKEAEQQLSDVSGDEQTVYVAEIASLLLRLGDRAGAEARLKTLRDVPRDRLVGRHLAEIETTLAEVAAVRQDWDAMQRHRSAALAWVPAEARHFSNRLDLLEIMRLRRTGDETAARAAAVALATRTRQLGDAEIRTAAESISGTPASGNDPVRIASTPRGEPAWLAPPSTTIELASIAPTR
jgi:DNA-binding winged helix-turn-helix (wHTH) protein/tetratricopeptide (TPR) repeat protein